MSATFVTIAGASWRCFVGQAAEDPPELAGDFKRLDSMEAQVSLRSPKRNYAAVLKCDPPSVFDTLRDSISVMGQPGVPTPVTVTSPADGLTRGVTLTAYCTLGKAVYRDTGAGVYKTTTISVPITIREA